MKPWIYWTLNGLGLTLVSVVVANASWLAPAPRGHMKLIAHGGTSQQYDHRGTDDSTCTAQRIEPPVHDYLENTITGLQQADRLGANMVQVNVVTTADGQLVLFSDWTLDCRTDGKGPIRKATLEQVQALDPGYGYTADGGKTFPLRGLPTSRIPTVEEAVRYLPAVPIVFNLKSRNPADAELLVRVLQGTGRKVEKLGDGFAGGEEVLAPLRRAFPGAWFMSRQGVRECTVRYLAMGWLTLVPDACKGGAIMVPQNYQWAFPGWPDRMIARMKDANVRIVLIAPYGAEQAPTGLDLPEQMAEIPASYTGYVWVDDIWTIGPALKPAANRRTPEQEVAVQKAWEQRRKARGLPEPRVR